MQFSSLAYYVFRYILDEIKQGSIDAAVYRSMSDGELYICTMRYYVVRWVDDEESGGGGPIDLGTHSRMTSDTHEQIRGEKIAKSAVYYCFALITN
jgi:hypothetical protein